MSQIPEVENFESQVLKADKPTLVKFWAPWCGPCIAMNPVVENLAKEHEGKLNVLAINVDEQSEAAGKYGVMSIPTMILFEDGEPVKHVVGSMNKSQLASQLGL